MNILEKYIVLYLNKRAGAFKPSLLDYSTGNQENRKTGEQELGKQ